MTQKASSDGTTYRDRSETGTLNEADEAVTLAVEEQDSFACQITTGLTGTLVAEVSVDGGTTYAATEFASKAGGATSSSLVNPGTGAYDILRTAGCTHVRVRCSAYTSGSAVVVLRGTETPPAVGAGLADIESAVDGLEANTADLDANTDQLEGYVDGLEALLALNIHADDYLNIGGTLYLVKTARLTLAASQTDASLVADVASKKIRVVGLLLMCGATATDITFNSIDAGGDTPLTGGVFSLGANGGVVLPRDASGWLESINAGEGMSVTSSAGASTAIIAHYVEI